MNKPTFFGILLVLLALLIGGGAWVWSLGTVTPLEVAPIQVSHVQGTVEIKPAREDAWKPLTEGASIQKGDELRTKKDSTVEVSWGNRGETRLDPETDVVITDRPNTDGAVMNSRIELKMVAGRAWSRFMKLFDVGSAASVQVGSVVATVRGTAFGVIVANQGMDACVTDSVVNIQGGTDTDPTLVREGRWGHFSATGTSLILRELTPKDEWPQENKEKDRKFVKSSREAALARLRRGASTDWLHAFSRQLHFTFASGREKSKLATALLTEQLASVLNNPESVPATLTETERAMIDAALSSDDGRDALLGSLRDAFAGVDQTTPAGRKVRGHLQFIRRAALHGHAANERYALALDLDDAIDDYLFDHHGGANVLLNEIDGWDAGNTDAPGIGQDERTTLKHKAAALRERLRGFGTATIPTEPLPPLETATTTTPEVTSTPAVLEGTDPVRTPTQPSITPTPTPGIPPKTTCDFVRLSLFVKPATAAVKDAVALTLFGSCQNGQTQDITAGAHFNAGYTSDGSFQGSTFYPGRGGVITLFGTYDVKGKTLSAQGSLTVRDAGKALTAVRVTALTTTKITTGQRVPLDAVAVYSDGTTTNVKTLCRWSVSDGKVGLVSSSGVFQHLQGTGVDTVSCTYVDGGVTVTGSIDITISLDTQLIPTQNKNPQYYSTFVP